MPKFLIIHNADERSREFMAKFSAEEKQAGMAAWMAWKDEAEKTVKFEWGLPLQPVARVTPQGEADCDNQASGYSIIEADSKDDVVAVLKNHPHLERDGATMDVLEMIPISEM